MLLRTLLPACNPFFDPVLVLGDVPTGEVGPLLMLALGDVRGVVRALIRGDVLLGLTLGVDLTVTCGVVARDVLTA